MSDHDERAKAGAIKVVDRRRFTAQGEVRPDAPARPEPAPQAAPQRPAQDAPPQSNVGARRQASAPAQPQQPTPAAPPSAAQGDPAEGQVDFLSFVASLATNAMAALGMLPEAERQGMPRNPAMAREYIEIIAMLDARTRGNLTAEESQAVTRLLGDLRMGYVEATRSVQPANLPPEMMRNVRSGH